jgi:hypothetical protein
LSTFEDRLSILRISVYALALIATIAILAHFLRHGRSSLPAAPGALTLAATPSTSIDPPVGVGNPRSNETQILAGCHPHLAPSTTLVPNIDVSEMRNPAAVGMKARFWVNGDGFVTQAFVAGANAYRAADQEAALDYIKILTFSVPNTPECRARKMEVIGNFIESKGSNGEWQTVLDLYPRYYFDGRRVVQSR